MGFDNTQTSSGKDFIMEEKNNEIKICPKCGHKMTADKKFCPSCMAPMPTETDDINNVSIQEEISAKQISEKADKVSVKETITEENPITVPENSTNPMPELSEEEKAALAQQKAENEEKKRKKQKKFALIGVIGAALIVCTFMLISFLAADRLAFDKDSATIYDAYGLSCYSPEGWIVREGTNEYNSKVTGTYFYDKDEEIAAYVGIQYLGEFDHFNDVMEEAKNNNVPIDAFVKDKTKATASLINNNEGWEFYTMIILCDRSGFLISGGATSHLYNEDILKEIINATDFTGYSSKGICEYIGGHEVDDEAWEETVASTCTEKGTEAAECTVCLQTVERELELTPHTVKGGETVESTCVKKGSVTGTCSVCEAEVTEELPLTEHAISDWIVDKEPTESTYGTRHKECTVCGKKLESETFTLTEEEIKATYKTGISYNQLSRDPDLYKGEKVKFSGKVLQVMEDSDIVAIRLATKGGYDNVIYLAVPNSLIDSRILEDDRITIYGKARGLYSYESVLGATITLPLIYVDYIDR